MSEPLPPDVRAALDASNKIEAIRLLRAHTGLGLHDAKEAVEAGSIPTKPQAPPALSTQLPVEAIAALQRGSKIDAIRIVRAKFSIGLKDAKDVVDAAQARGKHGRVEPSNSLAPGEVPTSRYGMALLLLVIALVAVVVWWSSPAWFAP